MNERKPGHVSAAEFKELPRSNLDQERNHALNHIAQVLDDINYHLSVIAGSLAQTDQHGQHSVKVNLANIAGDIQKIASEISGKR